MINNSSKTHLKGKMCLQKVFHSKQSLDQHLQMPENKIYIVITSGKIKIIVSTMGQIMSSVLAIDKRLKLPIYFQFFIYVVPKHFWSPKTLDSIAHDWALYVKNILT